MPMSNTDIIEKAAVALNDLKAGGLMNPKQFSTFYRKLIDTPTILKDSRTVPMTSDSMKIESVGFGQRILRPGVENTPLNADQRAKPSFGKVELNAREVIAEVNISYDTLENNIEGSDLKDTLITMMADRAALDVEELVINGDKAHPTDDYLKLIDGLLKKATAHVGDAKDAVTSVDDLIVKAFKKAYGLIPPKYLRNPAEFRFYTSHMAQLDYLEAVGKRQTALGDAAIQGGLPTALGIPVRGLAMMQPYEVAGAAAYTGSTVLLTHPKNIVTGISRNVRVEVDKDIRARQFIIVLTMKLDATFEEIDAVSIVKNVKNFI